MCQGFEMMDRVRFAAMTVGVLVVACLASRAASAGPIIHEVFYDAVGSDTGQVFTEIYGEAGMSLSGWSLVGINRSSGSPYRTIDLTGAVIPADSLLLIAQSSATPLLTGSETSLPTSIGRTSRTRSSSSIPGGARGRTAVR